MKKFKAFIALDATNNKKNIEVVKKLYKLVYGFKVGYRSFYNKDADKLIAEIKRKKSRLFLDLKLHDIPNTVSSAIESLKNINPDFLTLHISGGEEMLKSALKNIKKFNLCYINHSTMNKLCEYFGICNLKIQTDILATVLCINKLYNKNKDMSRIKINNTNIEKLYKVKIIKVNTVNVKPKNKMVRGKKATKQGYKKVIITLKKGDSIDLTSGL